MEIAAASAQAEVTLYEERRSLSAVLDGLAARLKAGQQAVEALGDEVRNRLRAREIKLSVIVADTLQSLTEAAAGRAALAPSARAVVECATFFAPDSVTEDWLRWMARVDHPELEDDGAWLRTLQLLDGRRLLTRTGDVGGLATRRLHRDVGAVVSDAMPAARRQELQARALEFLDLAGGEIEQQWRAVPSVRAMRRALADLAQHLGRDTTASAISEALGIASQIEAADGTLTGAIALIDAAASANPVDGSAQTRRVQSVLSNDRANLLRARGGPGDAEAAERLYRDSLATREAILRENPGSAQAKRDVADALSRLG